MLESLLDFGEINRKPYLMFIWAFIICSVSIAVSLQISYRVPLENTIFDMTGIFSVLFIVLSSVYLITTTIKREEEMEEDDIDRHHQQNFWPRHKKDIVMIMFFFAGMTLAFSVWSFFLPPDTFMVQISKINEIQCISGSAVDYNAFFGQILLNNLQVTMFSFFFSFIFGAGASFILTWNASILGVYIGRISTSFWHIPIVSMAFLPHGVPEIAGYVCAGLAGSLISAAIIRQHKKGILKIIATDSFKILLLGVVLIVLAAGIEAYL